MTDLAECPFCGGEALLDVRAMSKTKRTYRVHCKACSAATQYSYDVDRALAVWNARSATSRKPFEQMTAGEDGWSDWVHPQPGYLMSCCDCGLVHEVEVAVAVNSKQLPDGSFEWEDGQTPENKAIWRMRRAQI